MSVSKFIEICKMPQKELHRYLKEELERHDYPVYNGEKWVLGVGGSILVTSHMDTVHKEPVKKVVMKEASRKTFLRSPQGIGGDDRSGIYIILSLLEKGYRPTVLFTEDEEIGGIGAEAFIKDSKKTPILEEIVKSCGYMIEFDRANAGDAVFYDCDNPEFTEFILKKTGYKEAWGSFSDISVLAPYFERAAVNLSCGYYKAHTLDEYVVFEEMLNTVKVAEELLKSDVKVYEYIEALPMLDYRRYGGYGFTELVITYRDERRLISFDICEGETYEEAMYYFFEKHPKVCFDDIEDVEEDDYYKRIAL